MRSSRSMAAVAVVAFALAGCGTSKPAVNPRKDDPVIARALVLKVRDMPSGWTGTPPDKDADDPALEKRIADCVGVEVPSRDDAVTVDGQDLSKGTLSVSSSVSLLASAEQAKAEMAVLRNKKVLPCIERAVRDVLDAMFREELSAVRIRSLTARPLPLPRVGDDRLGARIAASIVAAGRVLRMVVDIAFVRTGRAGMSLAFLSVGAPFPTSLERAVLRKVDKRLAIVR
jgi:hypothetical protein